MKITVVGSGGWGTALAILLHKNGHQVTVWSYSQSEVDYIRENHENALLRGVTVPEDIQLTTDISAVKDADFVSVRRSLFCGAVYGKVYGAVSDEGFHPCIRDQGH